MSRNQLLCVVGGLTLVLGGVVAVVEVTPVSSTSTANEAPTLLAARYHLRSRTSNFHTRAKPGGGKTYKTSR